VTMVDLFTVKDGEAWNFVYGQAKLMDGLGVFSFSRYDPAGYPILYNGPVTSSNSKTYGSTTEADADADADAEADAEAQQPPSSDKLLLYRSAKVMAHETGHIFGIRHCIHYDCLMNGANHLEEFDSKPMQLCPICLRKLHEAVGFDVKARYEGLQAMYGQLGWSDQQAWVNHRLSSLDAGSK